MVQKRVSRSRKRELETPDEFMTYSAKFLEYTINHKASAIALFCIFFLIIFSFFFFRYYLEKGEEKAFFLLSKSIHQYHLQLTKDNDPEKAASVVFKDFDQIVNKYSGKVGGKVATFLFANICYDSNNFDKAIELYKKSLKYFENEPDIYNLTLSSLAYSYEKEKDYDNALKNFKIIRFGENSFLKDEALFNIAVIYAKTGIKTESLNAFQDIIDNYPDSIYIELAKERVAQKS